jgi:hypothetical protein
MSEQAPNTNHEELLPGFDQLEITAKSMPDKQPEARTLSPDKAREAAAEAIEINDQPSPLDKLKQAEKAPDESNYAYVDATELNNANRHRLQKDIQRKEALPVRSFSKLVHAPVVRQASEVAGATVSRPSGMLGGGLTALVGTSLYLYLAHHVGFQYNYLVFLLLFAGGFIIGLILEAIVHLALAPRRKANH